MTPAKRPNSILVLARRDNHLHTLARCANTRSRHTGLLRVMMQGQPYQVRLSDLDVIGEGEHDDVAARTHDEKSVVCEHVQSLLMTHPTRRRR